MDLDYFGVYIYVYIYLYNYFNLFYINNIWSILDFEKCSIQKGKVEINFIYV